MTFEHKSTLVSPAAVCRPGGVVLFLLLWAAAAAGLGGDGTPSAEEQLTRGTALLRGVKKKLSAVDSFHVEMEFEDRLSSDQTRRYLASADCSDAGTLFLVEWPDYGEKHSYLYREGEVMIYSEKEANLKIFDAETAVAQRGPILFDPRVIGLSDYLVLGGNIERALSLDGRAESITVEERPGGNRPESVFDVTVHSSSPIGKTRKTYTVGEPSFHVERVHFINEKEDFVYDVENQYDPSVSDLIPAVSKAYRVDTDIVAVDMTITVKRFEKKSFPKDYFEPKSMKIQHNTTFSDYRIHKTIGYWHAGRQELIDHWTDPEEINNPRPEIPRRDRGLLFRFCCGIGSLVILVILILRAKRRMEKARH
ncbi:MAG: hypothetical protein IJH68_08455 [Thermoguttaceae bacterium]|nr:hypothetical protein [Thermoguttaceae bacterium]